MEELKIQPALLNEVNSLVRTGESRVAKDLLREALESSPRSSLLWEALGRTLLTLGDQVHAIEALKTAHTLRNTEKTPNAVPAAIGDDLDLQYLDEIDDELRAVDHYEYGEEDSSVHSEAAAAPQKKKLGRLTLAKNSSIPPPSSRPTKDKISFRVVNGSIVGKLPELTEGAADGEASVKAPQGAPETLLTADSEHCSITGNLPVESLGGPSGSLGAVGRPTPGTSTPVGDEAASPPKQAELPPIVEDPIEAPSLEQEEHFVGAAYDSQHCMNREVPARTLQDHTEPEDEQDDYFDVGSPIDETELCVDALGEDDLHEVLSVDELDFDSADNQNILTGFLDVDEAELYFFDPDEVDDEDDSEPAAEILTRLTQEDRAYQIAIEFAHRFDWSTGHLDLLTTVFNKRGWGAIKKVLTHYAELGMTADELAIAAQIRSFWAQNMCYWIVFDSHGQSDARYKSLSWAQCFRMVRLFSGAHQSVPDSEEVLVLIEELYQKWFSSNTLRRYHRAFAKYLAGWIYQHSNSDLPLYALNGFGSLAEFDDDRCSDSGYYDLMGVGLNAELEDYGFSYGKGGLLRQAYQRDRVGEGSLFDKSPSEKNKAKDEC